MNMYCPSGRIRSAARRWAHSALATPTWSAWTPCVAKQVTRTDQESRSADPRGAASVTAMGITIHARFLPHDNRGASLAFYRDRPEMVPVVLRPFRACPG